MKHSYAKRHLLFALALCIVALVCALTVTTFAASRTSKFAKINLVLNENIDILFWADIDESTAKKENTYVTFNDGEAVRYSGMKSSGSVSYAVFRYNDILPQNMADTVTAKLYVGGALKDTHSYSIKEYCQYMLKNNTSDALKLLVSDLLVYGAASQSYLGESALVTDGVTGMTASGTPSSIIVLTPYDIVDNLFRMEQATFKSAGLILSNSVQMYFDVSISGVTDLSEYTAKLRINGREEEVPLTQNGSGYRAVFTSLRASEFFDTVSVGVYKNDSRISFTANYSVVQYLQTVKADNTSDAKLLSLANAVYNYGLSAHRYTEDHIVTMPGDVNINKTGSSSKDPSGTVTYNCYLCGEDMGTIDVSHYRNFDSTHNNGTPANNGVSFNTSTPSETVSGVTNKYMSVMRDSLTGTGAYGYYFYINSSNILSGSYLTSNSYTFELDVRAPAGGLAPTSINLQNSDTPSSGTGRFNLFLSINADGSLSNSGTAIAPAGTINSSKWTHITMMIELCEVNGETCVYTEYYVDGQLSIAVLTANTLGLDSSNANSKHRFTNIHIGVSPTGVTSGMGIQFDNFLFGQGAVHSFNTTVEQYMKQQEKEQMLEVADLIEASFDISQFSTVVTGASTTKTQSSMVNLDTTAYDNPFYYPTTGQHPRLLFNEGDIPNIVAAMGEAENSAAVTSFLAKVNTSVDGKLTTMHSKNGPGEYNYDDSVLAAIEAKALYYALFKDSTDPNRSDALMRGYQAIYAMKNYLMTLQIKWKSSDQCRLYGHSMYVAALVYDWCYDLLSAADREQLMLGVQNMCCDGTSTVPSQSTHHGIKLEVGFPPSPSGTLLTGHNAEFQVLRDLFAFSIAIYDEVPSWYDYIGGMICQDYVPTRNYLYTSGYYPDGSALYNYYRFEADLWNAWLFTGMGAELPYNAEDMSSVVHGLLAMETYGKNQFATGDGSNTSIPTGVGDCGLISSYLFEDSTARAAAMYIRNDYQSFGYNQSGISAADYLILSSKGVETGDDYQANVKNVTYHDGYQQQVIARSSKGANGVVVLMQGGQLVPGGHTHQSAGSFQIYYKGQLTRDDGLYDSYGFDHHYYYHMSTVAHNSLLIYNPNLAGSLKGDPQYNLPSANVDLYSGGQRHWSTYSNLPRTYETWITNDKYRLGKNIGMQTDSEDNPSYVYFANDITLAYDDMTVDYVERSINTVFTGDSNVPMVMFIFDHIDSDSANYQKAFLLQCTTEPSINGNVVTIDNGSGAGKLVLTSLKGADNILAYGRTSKNGVVGGGDGSERFWLSGGNGGKGYNLKPGGAEAGSLSSTLTDLAEVWGHVEIRPSTGSKENLLMNVIYVTDSGKTVSATPTLIDGTNVLGAAFKNHVSMFVKDPFLGATPLSFTSTGSGTMTYYIGGLNDGTWNVSVNGTSLGSYNVTADGNMLTFNGAVGTVTLTPTANVRPTGAGSIQYNTNGGTLPEGAPAYFYFGTGTSLPIPTRSGYAFGGWFKDAALTQPINYIGADVKDESVTLYAAWTQTIVDLDYSKGGSLNDYKGIASHNVGGGSQSIVGTAGNTYLLMSAVDSNASILKSGAYASLLNGETAISFEFTIAQDGSNAIQPTKLWFRDYNGDSQYDPHLFYLTATGAMGLGTSGNSIGTLTSTPTTVRLVIDFAVAKIFAYNAQGGVLASCDLTGYIAGNGDPVKASVYDSYTSWLKAFTESNNYLFSFQTQGTGKLRVYSFRVIPGNVYSNCRFYDATSSTHTWDSGKVITAASTTDCTPGSRMYTCQSCGITKYETIASSKQHTLEHTATDGKPTYSCTVCRTSWSPTTFYWADGTGTAGITDATTVGHSYTYENGYYELTNNSGSSSQLQLWIPSNGGSKLTDFSTSSNAVGFISFKVNAAANNKNSYNFKLADPNNKTTITGSNGNTSTNWDDISWVFNKDNMLSISFTSEYKFLQGTKYYATISGWSGELKKITLSGEKAQMGWIDVKIGVEMNEASDTITLHYFIDGTYIGSASKTMTFTSNSINSIYITGTTTSSGTGIMLDDVGFGYTTNGSEIPVN